ncbi:MAG: hybA [Deltaproteobacteria bacterium]|nr:hybA [Deltaproteobacteria bacterium]
MGISRRSALKAMAVATATTVATTLKPQPTQAAAVVARPDAVGMLYDATRCIGCKACMSACNKANNLPPDTTLSGGLWQMPLDLNERTKNIIKLYKDPATGTRSFVKRQCMHCLDPACVSACMLGALKKGQFGVVSYDPDLCIGCRYCQMSCPFNIPKFEWSKVFPKIVKCEFCKERLAQGQQPGCCEACPTGAVIFGKYTDLLADAHARLAQHPERYVPTIYGESEVGGTQVLYLSHVDFAKLGLPTYSSEPVPTAVRQVFQEIYQGIIPPLALYALLAAVLMRSRRELTGEAHDREEQ